MRPDQEASPAEFDFQGLNRNHLRSRSSYFDQESRCIRRKLDPTADDERWAAHGRALDGGAETLMPRMATPTGKLSSPRHALALRASAANRPLLSLKVGVM